MSATAEIRLPDMPTEEVMDVASMGEGLVLKNRKTVELDSKFSAQFLDYPEFIINDEKVDRNRSDSHVIYLARAMQAGTFLWEQVNLVLCSLEGSSNPIRLNGQHTCWARLVAEDEGLDPKTRCPVQLLRYEAKTTEDIRRLYASIDSGRPRSQGVKVNAYLAGTEEFQDVSKGTLRLMAQGIGVWLWPEYDIRALHGAEDRSYLLLKDHYKVASAVAAFLESAQPSEQKHFKRAPVAAAMFATFNKAPQIALEFWKNVRDGLGIQDKADPQRILRDWLMQASLAKSLYNGDLKTVSQEDMYRACIYRWNDHRAGRKSKGMRIDPSLPRPEPK